MRVWDGNVGCVSCNKRGSMFTSCFLERLRVQEEVDEVDVLGWGCRRVGRTSKEWLANTCEK